jgi:replicative superfamily II helicase
MLGRAGRPEYDDVGYGWVVCLPDEADRYRRLLDEGTPIESRLAEDLDVHLNAEIAGGGVTDLDAMTDWLESTYYAVRARSAPTEYDFGGLQDRLRDTVQGLVDRGFVETSPDLDVRPTELGRLASRYYLHLDTASRFRDLAERTADSGDGASPLDTGAILRTVAAAAEFGSVSARSDEREAIRGVVGTPDEGAPEDASVRKVLAVLRTGIEGRTPAALRGDAWAIRRNADRLLAALRAICEAFGGPGAANRVRRVAARLGEGVDADAVALTSIDGVGATRAETLLDTGIESPTAVREAGEDGLVAAGLGEGVAERVAANAADLPVITVDWDLPDRIGRGANTMGEVTVRNGGGGTRAAIRVSVEGRPMTTERAYLGTRTLPVAVFGADAETLTYAVTVWFPDLPLDPVRETRTVAVD